MWLLAPRNARSVTGYLADGGAFDEKKRRFLGIQYAGATDVAQRDVWLEGMRVAYPGVEEARYASSENFYDAVYWLTYGLAAAGPGAPTSGASIREGIRRLVSGPVVHPGNIESISYAFRTIGFGDVTFVGALGPPDIHTGFGTWNSVGSAYCYVNESGTIVPKYDGYRYDEDAGKLDDVNPCLFGF